MSIRIAPPAKGLVRSRTVRAARKMRIVRGREEVTVRTKREPERISVDHKRQDDRFFRAEELYAFWEQRFYESFGIEYVPKSRPADLASLDDVMDDIGDIPKIQKMIVLLLTHKELQWVTNKNLSWLAKPRNRTYIAPLMVQRKRTAEFSGERTLTTKITFRGS